jgi:hypothetical protein
MFSINHPVAGGTYWRCDGESHHITFQNTVMAEVPPTDNDGCGILFFNSDDGRVVNCEMWDIAGDCVQTNHSGNHARRLIIQNNDFYLTDAMLGEGGLLTRGGLAAAAENAIDIKCHVYPSELPIPEDEYMIIEYNRMWGFRFTDPNIGGSGGTGCHVSIAYGSSSGLKIRHNKIWNGTVGVGFSFKSTYPKYIICHDNVFWDFFPNYNGDQGTALELNEAEHGNFYRNIFYDSTHIIRILPGRAHYNTFDHNVFMDTGGLYNGVAPDGTNDFEANAYYDCDYVFAEDQSDGESLIYGSTSSANHAGLTFTIKRITDPTPMTIPLGQATGDSPHADWFDK